MKVNLSLVTIDFHEPTELATKLLPAISALLIDPEKSIRALAFKQINLLIKKIKDYSDTIVGYVMNVSLMS